MKAKDILGMTLVGLALAILGFRFRRRISFVGRVVFITGGSRGLGLALAREFAKQGARIAIVARDKEELDRAREDLMRRGAEVWTGVCDLRDPAQIEQAIHQAAQYFGSLDVLVNNAGEITVGPLETMTTEDFQKALEIHLWAPFFAMKAAIPHLRSRAGRIVNIVSIGGKVAIPHLAPYCMSKFALAGLSDAFRSELAKDNILVTSVFPGLMRTGSHVNAYFKGKHRNEFAWFSLGGALPTSSIAVARAARQIVHACRVGLPQLIISMQARLVTFAATVFPNTVGHLLAIVNRLLPFAPASDGAVHSGWESQSSSTPSIFTRLADRATEEYNGLRGHPPITKREIAPAQK